MITAAIIGMGARGGEVYARYSLNHPDELKIAAIADLNPKKVAHYQAIHQITPDLCFSSGEALLDKGKLADVLIVTSPDKDHYRHTMIGLKAGYDILLEKPISPREEEVLEIAKTAEQTGRTVAVCHVLRYAPLYRKIKEIIDSQVLGEIVNMNQVEHVGYWHQAHSFVRGNWRNTAESSPMILAKSCHDLDIIHWFLGKPCIRVSAFGSLNHFRKENAPLGSKERCLDCQVDCPFDAKKIYLENYQKASYEAWPYTVLTSHPTIESLTEALKTGPYGRCVYHCDNDVVDHEVNNLEFSDGVTAGFTMIAFTGSVYREIKIMGTKGELSANDHDQIIEVKRFDGSFDVKPEVIDVKKLAQNLSGHGGGDEALVHDFLKVISSGSHEGTCLTSIKNSIESHLIAFALEKSRLKHGEVTEIHHIGGKYV